MKSLLKRWTIFRDVVFDPWILLFLGSTGALIYLSIKHEESSALSLTLFMILITLSSAVLGGRISKQWIDATEGGIVKARGKSAVRGLKLLLNSIIFLNKRIDNYLKDAEIDRVDTVKLILEEIKEKCNILAEESVSSIENWTDIVPEADVKTHIGIISELRYEYDATAKDLKSLKEELSENDNASQEVINNLNAAIKKKNKELSELRKELVKKETSFGIGSTSASGGPYIKSFTVSASTPSVFDYDLSEGETSTSISFPTGPPGDFSGK